MPTNTFSCPNQKNANHVRILPLDTCYVSDMLKINLFTKLDDCKVNKGKLIYDKCGKDLKCKIDDKTMNELKKCFKFEIDDKTKNELKENIKNELKKEKEPDDVKEPDGVKEPDDVEEPDAGNDGYSEGMAFSYHGYGNDLI
ncbi:hypothetical protein HUB95_03835 [Wolbachia endosymbiont of Ceratosolen solmsi]|uniref:hypothetical protein n=1 Tax=unclassified Wolbachia TaxID=2640676 RepID=UPI0018D7D95E|nr:MULTISPECIES: hypothetical protein [unclassified Wolbachia]MBH5361903.1 hypothetical protein [Wolbachia endosymbiont of Kradibia gibbosae]QTP63134.1 hypothetical protein HUB95_03835 [Wolbachia endosymbiont of Ceratosolen solmsi]